MTRTTSIVAVAMMAAAGIAVTRPALTQSPDQRLGKVHFATSCTPAAQSQFDRAMLYQHSFWYRASQRAFEEALKTDPDCAIVHWGVALSLLYNPHAPPPAENLPLGLAALEKAKTMTVKTQRERDYLEAMGAMYADYAKVDHRTRVQNYLKAMEQLAQKYADDDEAQIHYALALNVAAAPTDKTYANQLKGAAILEKIHQRQPQHPGVSHYLIHLYDYPAIADKGIDAARRYAKIAPDAPHALHMPSHIFTRVGYWKESIASNLASANAAQESKEWDDHLHGLDYAVYAYLQLGQDKQAREIVDAMEKITDHKRFAGHYALAVSPARYIVERGDWKSAANLQVRPTSLAYPEAMTHFARALGAARLGDVQAAKIDVAKLAELRDKLREAKDAYWSEQVDIQRQVASAWLLYAEGRHDEALQAMSAAADAEDKTEKHPVTPGVPRPARELYGVMLLERGSAREALAAFEATLKKEPNRLGAYAGAAKAADTSGDTAKARQYWAKVVEQAADADAGRPEIVEARAYMAKKAL
jgi:tetratricopeptide (TPR) repeat protein